MEKNLDISSSMISIDNFFKMGEISGIGKFVVDCNNSNLRQFFVEVRFRHWNVEKTCKKPV